MGTIAAQEHCFKHYLPLLYGTDYADTRIRVSKKYDFDNNHLILFLGGNTNDSGLTEGGTGKRAWVARSHIETPSTNVNSQWNGLHWIRYFKNNQGISDVVSIDFLWNSVYLFVLSIDESIDQYYLTSMDINHGNTYN